MKTKTITVSHPWAPFDAPDRTYRVEKTTDSVEFKPHTFLSEREVDSLCDAKGWKVVVVPLPKR